MLVSERNMRSKTWWLTELCNSHYVSHFAAFFIDTRAERSTVESRKLCISTRARKGDAQSNWLFSSFSFEVFCKAKKQKKKPKKPKGRYIPSNTAIMETKWVWSLRFELVFIYKKIETLPKKKGKRRVLRSQFLAFSSFLTEMIFFLVLLFLCMLLCVK